MIKKTLIQVSLLLAILASPVYGQLPFCLKGKADVGFTAAHIEMLEAGHKVRDIPAYGWSGNATLFFMDNFCLPHCFDGLCFKPSFVYLDGDHGRCDLWNVGFGLGYYFPVTSWLSITPKGGITFGELDTIVDLELFGNIKQQLQSHTPYVGVDIGACYRKCWLFSFGYQWGWARTKTTMSALGYQAKTESTGPTYSVMVDYYISPCVSLNVAGSYNLSRDKEKYGVKVYGGRIGFGYTF